MPATRQPGEPRPRPPGAPERPASDPLGVPGADASLCAPYVIEFPFTRTVGPVIGGFLAGLRERRLLGARTRDGRVLVPALEFDPATSTPVEGLVEVGDTGTVVSWTWVTPRDGDVLDRPFAWALVRLDGADTALFHAVDADGDMTAMRTGMRVRARWAAERTGSIRDLACFEAAREDEHP